MKLINELIADVKTGTMTAAEAAKVVHPYAAEYYSPAFGEWDAYQEIKREWKKIQSPASVPTTKMEIEEKKCACGHIIPKHLVMSASLGTSCPECYDKMS